MRTSAASLSNATIPKPLDPFQWSRGRRCPRTVHSSALEIDAEVSARVAAGESIYTLNDARIRAIDPDLILAQDLCQVCAVPSGAVEEALDVIGCHAKVVSLDPSRLDEVIECIGAVGAATGTSASADALMERLRGRVDAVRGRVRGRERPRVLVLEWPDPAFNAGHWVPDQVEAAGGEPVLAVAGARSRRLTWEEIGAADVDITIFMPCGFDLEGAVAQAPGLLARPEAAGFGRVIAVDANAYFSRPGPRVVEGVELLEKLLHGASGTQVSGAQVIRP